MVYGCFHGEYKYSIVNGCFDGLYKSTYDWGASSATPEPVSTGSRISRRRILEDVPPRDM